MINKEELMKALPKRIEKVVPVEIGKQTIDITVFRMNGEQQDRYDTMVWNFEENRIDLANKRGKYLSCSAEPAMSPEDWGQLPSVALNRIYEEARAINLEDEDTEKN